ncbi:hypothetical protein X551_01820 [Methylibium sp. T29]|nr:hypothetical protein X551_01820 [Methylibium sp. T29]
MADDGADRGVDAEQHALRLAERIAIQHAGLARVGVVSPPVLDTVKHLRRRVPVVDRQAEGRFGDEGVAAQRFERCAARVRRELVVARDHPHVATVLESYLGRAEHVAGGVQRQRHAMVRDAFAVLERVEAHIAQPRAHQRRARARREVAAVPGGRGRRARGSARRGPPAATGRCRSRRRRSTAPPCARRPDRSWHPEASHGGAAQ